MQASFQAINLALLTGPKVVMLDNDFAHVLLADERLEQAQCAFRVRLLAPRPALVC